MPRKKDYSTMDGAQIGKAIVQDDVAQWLKASTSEEQSKGMSRYILNSDEWRAINERLGELVETSEKDIITYSNYNALRKYMRETFSINQLFIYYVIKSNSEPFSMALYTANTQEAIQAKIPQQDEEIANLFHLIDGNRIIKYFNIFVSQIKEVKEGIGTLYAMQTFVKLVSEKFKVPQLNNYLMMLDAAESEIEQMNEHYKLFQDTMNTIIEHVDGEQKDRAEEINAALNKMPLPLILDDLKPTEADIKRAKKDISLDTFNGGAPDATEIIAHLDRGGREWGF